MSHERHASSATVLVAEEDNMFVDILQEAPLSVHRQRRSIFGSVMYCLLLVGYAVVAAAAPWIFVLIPKLIPTLLCSSNVILLIVTGIFQQYLVYQVRKVRLQGYYTFSQKLKNIARLPFATVAYGTALMPSSSLEELRYHDGGRLSDQQMALLQYQRENLHFLSEEVLRLQECLSKYQRSDDGSTPQVDLAHLLASRDQELRALSAEMNQVHLELRLARSLIAERDTEIQRIRVTNNEYVEENERLRAILGEWSARAAKLERALEAERLSNMELQKSIAKLRNKPAGPSAEDHQA